MADVADSNTLRNSIVGGAIVIGLGIGWLVVSGDSKTGCTVTASGVAIIANGLSHGRGTTQIVVDAAAGAVARGACEALVDRLREEPAEPVALEVETPQGTGEVSVTGAALAQPAAVRTSCDDWLTLDYQQACSARQIGPPVIDLNPGQPTCQDWNVYVFVDACQQGRIGPPVEE